MVESILETIPHGATYEVGLSRAIKSMRNDIRRIDAVLCCTRILLLHPHTTPLIYLLYRTCPLYVSIMGVGKEGHTKIGI